MTTPLIKSTNPTDRRRFMQDLGLSAAALPFLANLPSLGFANTKAPRKQRIVVIFSPNGVVPNTFWPDQQGNKFTLKESLKPLEPYRKKTLILKGVCDKIRGDGDSHMRGIGCLLTGIELFPGNIQGGSHTPAGWAKGHSVDQEIKRFLQKNPQTRTRFGSLEFGVMVPDRADTWTRMVYAGPNKPIAPIDDPYQMFKKMYGKLKDEAALKSVLDDVRSDLKKLQSKLSKDDQKLLKEHEAFVAEMQKQLHENFGSAKPHAIPTLAPDIQEINDNIPQISKMQIDLMVNGFVNDFTRVATLQYTNSVGQARMKWLGINDSHHGLSHKPDKDKASQDKLTKINKWFCTQVAYLARRLQETPEPGGPGSLLDNTTIIWTNELGKGNSHTLNDIPFVLVGNGLNFKMGRSIHYRRQPHNRLLVSLANAFGHKIKSFGNPNYASGGALPQLT